MPRKRKNNERRRIVQLSAFALMLGLLSGTLLDDIAYQLRGFLFPSPPVVISNPAIGLQFPEGEPRTFFDAENTNDLRLDVVFLIDATGSMSDEIEQLQNNIIHIAGQIDALGGVAPRYGLVAYRDTTDDFLTTESDFVQDVGYFQQVLNTLRAGGGGDNPEALSDGLQVALNEMSWGGDDVVKLIVLVADAPAQLYNTNGMNYDEGMQIALERGIKIHTIASSGLNQAGEYILRQLAQYTRGRFIFLTYDEGNAVAGTTGDSRSDLSVGEPVDETGQGDYNVEQLDELVLRLIVEEIAPLLDS